MKIFKLSGLANVAEISISADSITLKYDEPSQIRQIITAQQLELVEPVKLPVAQTVSEYMGRIQAKSAKARCANETEQARRDRMSKLANARWSKHKIKPI